ncbi:hypothetical protein Tco_0503201, partial [Tanacetum coccineum]
GLLYHTSGESLSCWELSPNVGRIDFQCSSYTDGYLDGLQFGVGVSRGSEAILHSANRLIEACGDDVGLLMLLVDFKNAFNLGDQ